MRIMKRCIAAGYRPAYSAVRTMTRTKISAITLVTLVFLLIASCSGGGPGGPTAPAEMSSFQVESILTDLVNQARSSAGVSPDLHVDPAVSQVARAHSEAMRDRGFFSHADPEGNKLRDRLRVAGVTFRSAGENLAQVGGASDPAGMAHRMLMDSNSHRKNILSDNFSVMGIGVAKRGSEYWITQIFLEM